MPRPALKAAKPLSRSAEKRFSIIPIAALIVLPFLSYLPALHAGFIWDDDAYVTSNPTLRSARGLWEIWTHPHATPQYYPLVHTTFWIEYHLWGTGSAVGYHLSNILLHIISALLLYRLLHVLKVPGAWLAAAIFACHPVNVESIAWITERKNCLSTVFYLLAFAAYLRWSLGPADPASGSKNRKNYLLSFAYFVLALLSKTVTATLPAAILLVLWWKLGKIRRRDIFALIPFFITGAAMGDVTGYLERTHVGAHGPEWAFTFADRVLIASRAICFYAMKLVLPINLTFIYPRWTIDSHNGDQYLYLLPIAGSLILLFFLRQKTGRGPLVAVLFYMGTLFPALGFANVYPMRYSFVADHFQYLASVGLLTLFAAVIHQTFCNHRVRYVAVSTIILMTLVTLTARQTLIYRDSQTLWQDTLSKNPGSWMAHTNLGHALHAAGDDEGAWRQYQQALALAPGLPEPHFNVGLGDAIRGDTVASIAEYQTAIALDPGYAPAYANLAKIQFNQNDLSSALTNAERAVSLSPEIALGHYIRARVLEQLNRPQEAAAEYENTLSLTPDDAAAHFHLADTLMRLHQTDAATAHYETSLAIDPQNAPAWTTLGYLHLAGHRPGLAASCFQHALKIDPALRPAQLGLQQLQ